MVEGPCNLPFLLSSWLSARENATWPAKWWKPRLTTAITYSSAATQLQLPARKTRNPSYALSYEGRNAAWNCIECSCGDTSVCTVVYFRWRHAVQPSPYTYTHAYTWAKKEERGQRNERTRKKKMKVENEREEEIEMDKKTSNKE